MSRTRLVVLMMLLLAVAPVFACDVASFDPFSRLVIQYQGQAVHFQKGRAYAYFSPKERKLNQPEWGLSVTRSVVLHPEHGMAVRLVLIHTSHLRGSGDSNILLGLQCIAGRQKVTLRLQQPIKRLVVVSQRAFNVIVWVWQAGDALADPSRVRVERYRWREPGHDFQRSSIP